MLNLAAILEMFYKHMLIIKTFHFQTKLYGAHKASDNYLSSFSDSYDKFMELAQGIDQKIDIKNMKLNIIFKDDNDIIPYLKSFNDHLYKDLYTTVKHTALLNVIDDMGQKLGEFIYLLSFK